MSSEKKVNSNSSYEVIFENIKKYGPVSAIAVADALQITPLRVMQAVSYMKTKKNINIQKKGPRLKQEYSYDPQFPLLKDLTSAEKNWEKEYKEEDQEAEEVEQLFDSLLKDREDAIERKKALNKKIGNLDYLIDRCYHLILALENCSNGSIMDNFNLDEEQARVLLNKVMTRYSGLSLSFTVHVSKGNGK